MKAVTKLPFLSNPDYFVTKMMSIFLNESSFYQCVGVCVEHSIYIFCLVLCSEAHNENEPFIGELDVRLLAPVDKWVCLLEFRCIMI